jgi:hypothetical protein
LEKLDEEQKKKEAAALAQKFAPTAPTVDPMEQLEREAVS